MSGYLFQQLKFVRTQTLSQVEGLNERGSLFVPRGFNNNIKWNLGHIYVVQERFAFLLAGQQMTLPQGFQHWFATGTRPADWEDSIVLPSIQELHRLLKEQVSRVEAIHQHQLQLIVEPYTTSTGLSLYTVEELLSFCLYHEGMHMGAIKSLKQSIETANMD